MSNPTIDPDDVDVEHPSPIIAIYERIAAVSRQMRNAALDEQWDLLVNLGKQYVVAVQALKTCPSLSQFSPAERAQRTRLLVSIIEDDQLIRDLAQPELARVGAMISQGYNQKNMLKAYAGGFGHREDA